jgi:hypothetical protein
MKIPGFGMETPEAKTLALSKYGAAKFTIAAKRSRNKLMVMIFFIVIVRFASVRPLVLNTIIGRND